MTKKRLKKNKHRAMNRRRMSGKKPMSPEQKEAQKKINEANRVRSKAVLDKARLAKSKLVK